MKKTRAVALFGLVGLEMKVGLSPMDLQNVLWRCGGLVGRVEWAEVVGRIWEVVARSYNHRRRLPTTTSEISPPGESFFRDRAHESGDG